MSSPIRDILTRGEYLLFEGLIEQESGIRVGEFGTTALRGALCDRLVSAGVSSFGEYYELLTSPPGDQELASLIDTIAVHETAFFRNAPHFRALATSVIPELVKRNAETRTLRVWSAGCSTGQEAYSIAMSLLESFPSLEEWRIEILGTDISVPALDSARSGFYSPRNVRNLSQVLLERYFEQRSDGLCVADRVKRMVRFEHLNLVKEPFPLSVLRPCDLIFCENVTIYFKVESTRRVIRNFYNTLREGCYLFLGYSETLWNISEDFALEEMDGTFVYRKRGSRDAGGFYDASKREDPASLDRIVSAPIAPDFCGPVRVGEGTESLEQAEALYQAMRYEEALLVVESRLMSHPDEARSRLLAGRLRADREEFGAALAHCRRAVDADPLLGEGHFLIGLMLMRLGEVREAAVALSKVVSLDPAGRNAAMALFHLAEWHADSGDSGLAVRECRNALHLLERLPRNELLGEFSADFLARVCRRRLLEMERKE